jgi:hypothetical protein|tara:strand:- start:293 stop:2413 length:2121 start_codon:yes stop_codon:yes gene_type:complete
MADKPDEIISLTGDKNQTSIQDDLLVGIIKGRLGSAEDARFFDEERWLRAYRNYRGVYGNDMSFTDTEKSRVFVKVTKTKVLAAYGQITDVLFSSGKFPIGVDPTQIPDGISQYAHIDKTKEQENAPEEEVNPYGFSGDGKELPKGATYDDILGGLSEKYNGEVEFTEGPAPDLKKMPQIEPAQESADNMKKLILDQLEENNATKELRHTLFEMALLGTGILKGPFTFEKDLHRWTQDPETGSSAYTPSTKVVPMVEAVSCWDFYPDPEATKIEDCNYVIQRHKLTSSQLRDLTKRPFFREDEIISVLSEGPNYQVKGYEHRLQDRENETEFEKERFEVLEYWGKMDKKLAEEAGLELDLLDDDLDEVQVNCWVSGQRVLRLVLNPFTPARLPYLVTPYELNPYQFFGVGVPENMEDSQTIMNGHARMAIDNLALAGNLVFDVDETMLVPGQDLKVYPGKIFRRQSGMPGQSIHGLKFPNTAQENLQMFDKFRQLADESTGIPSYSHGQTGVQSTTRTAAGMSMLMGAAALNIKTVIKNVDDYLLKPLAQSLFQWNMQFNSDVPAIVGDLEVSAKGTQSLMMKEVRSQRLMTLLQVGANPTIAPFIKYHAVLREIAKTLDLDPDQLINDPEKAAIYSEIIGVATNGNQQAQGNGQQPPMGGGGEVPAGANPNDPTGVGGGNIGTGSVPQTGEPSFASQTPPTQRAN